MRYNGLMSKHEKDTLGIESADSATGRLCRRVKKLRRQRALTLEQLAELTGVSRSMLSQIEREQVNPTFHVAYRIAQAFGISLGELVDEEPHPPTIEVVRGHDEKHLFSDDGQHRLRTLYPMHLEKDVEFYEIQLRPNGALRSSPHIQGTREFLTIQKGRVRVISGDQSVELAAGDSARYLADVDHSIENIGRGEAVGFLVAVYRT